MIRDAERAADSLYLIAHHSATGRPHLGPRLLGLGLAAALLGELVLGGMINLEGETVYALDRRPFLRRVRHYSGGLRIVGWCSTSYQPVRASAEVNCPWCGVPGIEEFPEPVARDAWQLMARDRELRPVRDWLTVLAQEVPVQVARRLEADGWLVAEHRRSWLGRPVPAWTPRNVVEADSPRQVLRRIALGVEAQPDMHQRLVAGLVDALQLTRLVLADVPDPAAAGQVLLGTVRNLDPSLRYLVGETRAAAGNAVISHTG